jgi:hypothetical protein
MFQEKWLLHVEITHRLNSGVVDSVMGVENPFISN